MPWTYLGFRPAAFGFAAVGAVSPSVEAFFTSVRYNPAFGFGFRFHNEHLVFDAFELTFFYFPSATSARNDTWFRVSTVPELALPEFSPGSPSVFPYF